MLGIYQLHLSFCDLVLLLVVQEPIKRSLLSKLGHIQLAAFRLQIQHCVTTTGSSDFPGLISLKQD